MVVKRLFQVRVILFHMTYMFSDISLRTYMFSDILSMTYMFSDILSMTYMFPDILSIFLFFLFLFLFQLLISCLIYFFYSFKKCEFCISIEIVTVRT